jgi:hypothetical protein
MVLPELDPSEARVRSEAAQLRTLIALRNP